MVDRPNDSVNGSSGSPINRWAGASDAFEQLGEPWTTWGRLLLREDDARAREQAAATRSDFDAKARAELEREDTQADIQRFMQHHSSWFLTVLRWTIDSNPTALAALLDPAFRTELDVTQQAVVDAEERIDKLEDAVVALEDREGARDRT